MNMFYPVLGGLIIGLSSVFLMLLVGKIAGISGITWRFVSPESTERRWSFLFLAGLIIGTLAFHLLSGKPFPDINVNYPLAIIAGLFVGVGVKLGNGCTSGHGVCGIGRLSVRSLVATITFMIVAVITVAIVGLVL